VSGTAAERPSASAGAGETILLVEDEDDVRRVIANTLRRYGYDAIECGDGEEALAAAGRRDARIDVLLTDVIMKGLKGPELAARVRALRPGIKVLYMSGHPESVIGDQRAADEGALFLQKPFGPEQLTTVLRRLLGSSGKKTRVLLVDDDHAVRRLLRRVLTSGGYDVTEACDGKQATTAVQQQAFDLVITDLVMPEQEGLETITQIRKRFPAMKIIAVSGAFGGRFLQVGERLGANATLAKPVLPQDLLATVERVIAQ
jgi:CheY-like chemotaxis protein